MSDVPTVKELQKLRVVDLKERLTKLGVSTSGLKADLVARLHETLARLNQDDDEGGSGDSATNDSEPQFKDSGDDNTHDADDHEKMLQHQQHEAYALEQQQQQQFVPAEQHRGSEAFGYEQQQAFEQQQQREAFEQQQREAIAYEQQQQQQQREAIALEQQRQAYEQQQHEALALDQQRREAMAIEEKHKFELQQREAYEQQQREAYEQQQREAFEQQQRDAFELQRREALEQQQQMILEQQRREAIEQQQHEAALEQQREMERQQREMEHQREIERQQREMEIQERQHRELEQQREMERQQRELEQREFELQQQRELERQQREALEQQQQRELERQRQEELERQREFELRQQSILEEQHRLEMLRLEQERQDRLERERLEQLRLEQERQERLEQVKQQQRMEQERLEQERLKQEKLEQERLEQDRLKQECLEQEILEKKRLEEERLQQERFEQERVEQLRLEAEREAQALEEVRLLEEEKARQQEEQIKAEQQMIAQMEKERSEKAEQERLVMEQQQLLIEQQRQAPLIAELPKVVPETTTPQPIETYEQRMSQANQIPFLSDDPEEAVPVEQQQQSEEDRASPGLLPTPSGLLPTPPSNMMIPAQPGFNNMPPPQSSTMPLQPPPFPHQSLSGFGMPPQQQQQSTLQEEFNMAHGALLERPERIPSRHPMTHAQDDPEPEGGHFNQEEPKQKQLPQDQTYHLPSAIEKVLAKQTERAQEVEAAKPRNEKSVTAPKLPLPIRSLVAVDEEDDDMEDEDGAAPPKAAEAKLPKESKNKRRKEKKKRARQRRQQEREQNELKESEDSEKNKENTEDLDVEIDYIPDTQNQPKDPLYFQFLRIFEKFKLLDPEKPKEELSEEKLKELQRQEEIMNRLAERKKPADIDEKDDDDDDRKEEDKPKLSKRKLKKLNRMSVAELKQRVGRPELVEMHDVTAKDPVLLLHLKAARNSVPVPRHWCFKRKYLQGKRGIEKPPFMLPEFIKKTGIMEMRQALQEKEEQKTMKAKMRERVRPKMGKIDIDYQKLHDAFFKWQIKPRMTIHGDLYYEGKEFETRLKEKKPGDLSEELRMALGMPTGPNQNRCPPPWLIAMQRYGPPPSYPNLKIPGLNAPIPESCSFGYHAGGWGKPPVDEMGRPLYGDVFGTQMGDPSLNMLDEEVDRSLWGELESESSEESEEESEEEEEEEKVEDESGLVTPAEGLVTPSGLNSVPAGMETPDMIELRKRKIEAEMEGGETPALYTILPEKTMDKVGGAMMGSTHIYDMTAAMQQGAPAPKPRGVTGAIAAMMPPQGVEVTLDPSELEMDSVAMAARYEQTVREQQSQLAKEDLSDMVAEHAARQKNKRKKQQQDTSGKTAKKYKEFKF